MKSPCYFVHTHHSTVPEGGQAAYLVRQVGVIAQIHAVLHAQLLPVDIDRGLRKTTAHTRLNIWDLFPKPQACAFVLGPQCARHQLPHAGCQSSLLAPVLGSPPSIYRGFCRISGPKLIQGAYVYTNNPTHTRQAYRYQRYSGVRANHQTSDTGIKTRVCAVPAIECRLGSA